MASQSISGQPWPDGTVASVYYGAGLSGAAGATPSGPVLATGTVTGGSVTFTGLLENVRYVAWASGKGVQFLIPQPLPGARGPVPDPTAPTDPVSKNYVDTGFVAAEGRNPALTLGAQPQVVTVEFNAETDHPGGVTGLRLNRTDNTYAMGIKFTVADVPKWDFGLDAGTTDFVLAYDADEPADMIRLRQGGHLDIARSCGHPTDTHRLQVSSDNLDDAALRDVVVIDVTAGSPAVNALVCIENAVAKFTVAKGGDVTAQGDIVSGKSGGIMQASRLNAGNVASPNTRALNITQNNIASAYGGIGLNNSAGRNWSLLSGTPGYDEAALSIRDDTGTSTRLIISSTGFGFNGVAPARPALTAAATDPATTMALANSIRSALITLGLTT